MTDIEETIPGPASTTYSLKMGLMPSTLVLHEPGKRSVDTLVLAAQSSRIPAAIVTQGDTESLLHSIENHIGAVDKSRQSMGKDKANKQQNNGLLSSDKGRESELLSNSHWRDSQFKADHQESVAAPESSLSDQKKCSKNSVRFQASELVWGQVPGLIGNVDNAPEGPAGEANSSGFTPAHYLRRHPPRYPERARALGQQGVVVLHAGVLPSGYSQYLTVAVFADHRLLDGAALAAVKQWPFVPAYAQGHPVAHWVSVPVRFTLQ
mgnify:CR=1 FL=1